MQLLTGKKDMVENIPQRIFRNSGAEVYAIWWRKNGAANWWVAGRKCLCGELTITRSKMKSPIANK
jgi:hypothetical protein